MLAWMGIWVAAARHGALIRMAARVGNSLSHKVKELSGVFGWCEEESLLGSHSWEGGECDGVVEIQG